MINYSYPQFLEENIEDLFENKGEWMISNFEDLNVCDLEDSKKLKLISDISLTELKNILNDYKRSIAE